MKADIKNANQATFDKEVQRDCDIAIERHIQKVITVKVKGGRCELVIKITECKERPTARFTKSS